MTLFTIDGTDSTDQRALPCQPNVLIPCDVVPMLRVGYREGIQGCQKAWSHDKCVITGIITAATSKTIFRSRTAKATSFTS